MCIAPSLIKNKVNLVERSMTHLLPIFSKNTLATILLVFIAFVAFATTGIIEGKVIDENSGEGLPFANVTIQVNKKTVGTQTDFDGYYIIKDVPVGKYNIETNYMGYKSLVVNDVSVETGKTTTVDIKMGSNAEVLDEIVLLNYNYSSRKKKERNSSKGSRSKVKEYDVDDIKVSGKTKAKKEVKEIFALGQIEAGQLTAGEIHDFSKWELWNDLSKNELSEYKTIWSIYPKERYVIQAVTEDGFPVVDATVSLNIDGKTTWTAKTDNTGKAELWDILFNDEAQAKKKESSIEASISYKGIKNTLPQLKQFKDGINIITFKQDCIYAKNLDIAFVVDATGSMGDEIEYLKIELLDVINRVQKEFKGLNIRLGNVFYRDKAEEYLTKKSPLTKKIKDGVSFISDQKAVGGGDFPEAVDAGLDVAINELQWSDEAVARIMFLVLDAPPHQNDEVNKKLQEKITKAAQKGIRIVPIVCSGIDKSTEYLLRSFALATNGHYLFLTDDSGIGGTHLKPSTDNYDVRKLNNLLVDIITRYARVPDCNGKGQQEIIKIDQPELNNSVKIFPNPSNGLFSIESNTDLKELFITDMNGKIIIRLENFEAGENKVDIANFPTGIYFVRYILDGKVLSEKVVKR